MKKSLFPPCAVLAAVLAFCGATARAAPVVYLAGDSTVMTYPGASYPKQGWGARMKDLFPAGVTFSNRAVGGRSSKSFVDEGRLAAILGVIQPGDYLFVQFAHNDVLSDPRLHTDTFTSYKVYLAMYVDLARQYGAIPVLVTPMGKRRYDSGGVFLNDFADRSTAMKQLAQEKSVPLIDLNAKSIGFYNGVGAPATTDVFLWLAPGQYASFPNGVYDPVHFQEYGAGQLARLVVEGVEENRLPLRSLIGPVTYPAEAAVLAGAGTVRSRNYGGWQGRGYVDFPVTGGSLTLYKVIGKAGGARTLRFRYANGAAVARGGQLVVNGVASAISFAPTGGWSSWGTKDVVVSLNGGTANTVTLRSTGSDLGNIDGLTVY
jgi:lysophospholipase L1-like esterase